MMPVASPSSFSYFMTDPLSRRQTYCVRSNIGGMQKLLMMIIMMMRKKVKFIEHFYQS